jgi:predicted dehydrogenase
MGIRHLKALKRLNVEIVGICDPRQQSLDEATIQEGIPHDRQYKTPLSLLRETRPDCVIVAATADAHCELTCMAAEHGATYVLCEKPMAVSIDQCLNMIEACNSSGARLAVNHPMRFMASYTEPKAIIDSEAFGGLESMTVIGGNFGIAMNGTHFFEAFRFLADEDPYEVTAWLTDDKIDNPRGAQFEDRGGSVRIITRSGKRFYMECGVTQGHGIMIVYAGPMGQVVVNHMGGKMFQTVREAVHREMPTTRYGMPSVDVCSKLTPTDIVEVTAAVTEALFNGKDFPSGEEGMLAIQTLVASHMSHELNHQPVKVRAGTIPSDRTFLWA